MRVVALQAVAHSWTVYAALAVRGVLIRVTAQAQRRGRGGDRRADAGAAGDADALGGLSLHTTDGGSVPAFAMPMGKLELRVDRFLPADALEVVTLPLPFSKDKPPSAKRRAAHVRLTVDGRAEEFWLAGMPIQPVEEPPGPEGHFLFGSLREFGKDPLAFMVEMMRERNPEQAKTMEENLQSLQKSLDANKLEACTQL